MPDNQLDINVRLLLEGANKDRQEMVRLLKKIAGESEKTGKKIDKGLKVGQSMVAKIPIQ